MASKAAARAVQVAVPELERIDLLHARYASDKVFKANVRNLIETFWECGRLIVPPNYYAKHRDAVDLAVYRLGSSRPGLATARSATPP